VILIIDNYDSFVFNVARYVVELGEEAVVRRNDALDVATIERSGARGLILSPGPCTPLEAGVSLEAVRHLSGRLPILGICLGHQCIGQAFGGHIARARTPMHGRASTIRNNGQGLFTGLPGSIEAGRYHSLIVELDGATSDIEACAWSDDDEIMALVHRTHPTFGVQFHPESVLTPRGYDIIGAFLERTR
jgi:anthranilate synthase component 2/para-aminobenzoate synthetase component 2